MRILHVLDHSLPLHSGYTFRTAAILREQRARGWETIQLTSPRHRVSAQAVPSADSEQVEDLEFLRTRYAAGAWSVLPAVGRYLDEMRCTAARIEQVARARRPDLLHAHSPVLNALPALRTGARLGLPVVYEVRACWEDAAVDHGTTREGSLRYRMTRALETHALRRADAVTVICDGLRREFESRGIASDKITVIPNAVDVAGFEFGRPADPALRREMGLLGATVLGFVGSFYAYEGLDLLLRAFAVLRGMRGDLALLFVGGGPQEAALQALARELGVAEHVRFAGRVPHARVQGYYDQIDLLAYPRRSMRLTELVTPLKPLEAMAQGRVFVASDGGGHRELVRDGTTGFLFEAGSIDSLVRVVQQVLDARELWPRVRQQGREFVERERTWARSVGGYLAAYSGALGPAAAGPLAAALRER